MTALDLTFLKELVNTVAAFAALFISLWFAWKDDKVMALYFIMMAVFFRVGSLLLFKAF